MEFIFRIKKSRGADGGEKRESCVFFFLTVFFTASVCDDDHGSPPDRKNKTSFFLSRLFLVLSSSLFDPSSDEAGIPRSLIDGGAKARERPRREKSTDGRKSCRRPRARQGTRRQGARRQGALTTQAAIEGSLEGDAVATLSPFFYKNKESEAVHVSCYYSTAGKTAQKKRRSSQAARLKIEKASWPTCNRSKWFQIETFDHKFCRLAARFQMQHPGRC